MNPSWLFFPNSPQAQATANIFFAIMAIALVIFAIVFFVLLYSIAHFRQRKDQGEPAQVIGSVPLEIVWTAIPALTLLGVFIYMLQVMTITQAAPASQADLLVIGHQWWWEIHYPKSNVVTANEIHLPVGQRYLVETNSADVIHDLWIPQLGDKMDLVPGQPNWTYLEGNTTGVFLGQCAEYCGTDHALMLLHAYVQSQADFDAWIKDQSQTTLSPEAQNSDGAKLFVQLPCQSCHALDGISVGTAGPDLTHLGGRSYIATFLPNTPQNMTAWLKNPQLEKPGTYMPNLGLTDDQLKSLVEFLESLK